MRLVQTINILLVILLAACGVTSTKSPSKAHYLVNILYLGSNPPNTSIVINEIEFALSGCKSMSAQKLLIKPIDNNYILNLYLGDTGCSVQLTQLKVTVNNVADVLQLNSQSYCGTTSKLCIDITLKNNLPATLQSKGEIIYYFLPFVKENITEIDSVVLPVDSINYPKLIPHTITNLGIGNTGKQKIGMIFECSDALIFWDCGFASIKSYLLKLMPLPSTLPTEEELFALMTPSSEVMIPNESHYFGNGIRLTFEIEPTDPLNLLLITSANNVVRYFVLTSN